MKKKSTTFVYPLEGKLYINLTNRCSNDCVFCLRNTGDGVKNSTLWLEREPSAEDVIKQIDAAGFEYSEAVFCGYGESTYRLNELCAVADYLKLKGVRVRLNTNGLGNLINEADITPRLKGRIDSVSVSLNSASAEEYLKLCRPVFGLKAYEGILIFTKKCVEAGIETILTAVDVIDKKDLESCKKTALNLGAEFKVRAHISDNGNYV